MQVNNSMQVNNRVFLTGLRLSAGTE